MSDTAFNDFKVCVAYDIKNLITRVSALEAARSTIFNGVNVSGLLPATPNITMSLHQLIPIISELNSGRKLGAIKAMRTAIPVMSLKDSKDAVEYIAAALVLSAASYV